MFAAGSSKEFRRDVINTIKYLNKHGAGSMFAELHSSKNIYTIKEGDNRSSFTNSTKTINWDPNMGVITDNGIILSPASVLNHELDHALHFDKKPLEHKTLQGTKDTDYDNQEEKRVITGSEQDTATKLGEKEKMKQHAKTIADDLIQQRVLLAQKVKTK